MQEATMQSESNATSRTQQVDGDGVRNAAEIHEFYERTKNPFFEQNGENCDGQHHGGTSVVKGSAEHMFAEASAEGSEPIRNNLSETPTDSNSIADAVRNGMSDTSRSNTPQKCDLTDPTQISHINEELEHIPNWLRMQHAGIKRLDLSHNKLRTITGLEQFSILEELILDNNLIDDETIFPRLPGVHTLMLNKNLISNIQLLVEKVKESFPMLTYLSLIGNPACPNEISSPDHSDDDYQRYRYYVICKMPSLHFLDWLPITHLERQDSSLKGPYSQVVRLNPSEESVPVDEDDSSQQADGKQYRPLPDADHKDGIHKGSYSLKKHEYYGKNSEGNRFIRDSDL